MWTWAGQEFCVSSRDDLLHRSSSPPSNTSSHKSFTFPRPTKKVNPVSVRMVLQI